MKLCIGTSLKAKQRVYATPAARPYPSAPELCGDGPSHDAGTTTPPAHLHAIPPRASGFKISHEAWDPAEPGYPLLRAAQGRAAARQPPLAARAPHAPGYGEMGREGILVKFLRDPVVLGATPGQTSPVAMRSGHKKYRKIERTIIFMQNLSLSTVWCMTAK